MKYVKWILIVCAGFVFMTGCSPDVHEISDIALVMATGIDYDKEHDKYIFTAYGVLPSTGSAEKPGKQAEWVASAAGNSILDAAKNLRSQAGKALIWQHNKFFVIGEKAARQSIYEIVDFLSRNREVRITSYLMVSEGEAADKLKVKSRSGDFISNELLGKIRNEKDWGKSISLTVKDVVNCFPHQHRGFVIGRLSTSDGQDQHNKVLALKGGSVFGKGKFIGWMGGKDVIVVQLLADNAIWKKIEFTESVDFKSTRITVLYRVSKKTLHSKMDGGNPHFDIEVKLNAIIGDMNQHLAVTNRDTIRQLEQAAAKQVELMIKDSLKYFQKDLNVDVLGFSDYLRRNHAKDWKRIESEWESIYSEMPIQVHVDVKFEKLGMTQVLGES
ncbi:Ger(x)C family spore germination protein [Paenibacillus sp. GCM10027628]|uniref:Ger(x)C family spore germination protein n=1 Tax=Paenibacillus sp. GCM10027628 TaxID=3273413 RepID=UPI003637866D